MRYFILSSFIMIIMACSTVYAAPVAGSTVYADIDGLVCDFCARALEKTFGRQDAVQDIQVDLDKQMITINFKEAQALDDEKIRQLIEDSGYNLRELRYEAQSQAQE
jgi:copper chaperone CopZ